MDDKNIVVVKALKAYYRMGSNLVKAVDDVSFSVSREEVFGLAGESGCGKSTLALSMVRMIKPPCYIESGEVLFEKKNILKLSDEELRKMRMKRFSYIPQGSMNALNPVRKIGDHISDLFKAHTEKVDKNEIKKRTIDVLEQATLSPKIADMYPHELSGGMKQRAVIAFALSLKPSLIIADEPTTALDVNVQKIVLQTLRKAKDTIGASLVLITHDMAVQAEIVDRLAIMYAGKIVEIGNVDRIFEKPFHPYTEGLMLAIPTVEEKRKPLSIPGSPPDLVNPPPGCRFCPRCSRAMEICSSQEPALIEMGNDQWVSCHLYNDN